MQILLQVLNKEPKTDGTALGLAVAAAPPEEGAMPFADLVAAAITGDTKGQVDDVIVRTSLAEQSDSDEFTKHDTTSIPPKENAVKRALSSASANFEPVLSTAPIALPQSGPADLPAPTTRMPAEVSPKVSADHIVPVKVDNQAVAFAVDRPAKPPKASQSVSVGKTAAPEMPPITSDDITSPLIRSDMGQQIKNQDQPLEPKTVTLPTDSRPPPEYRRPVVQTQREDALFAPLTKPRVVSPTPADVKTLVPIAPLQPYASEQAVIALQPDAADKPKPVIRNQNIFAPQSRVFDNQPVSPVVRSSAPSATHTGQEEAVKLGVPVAQRDTPPDRGPEVTVTLPAPTKKMQTAEPKRNGPFVLSPTLAQPATDSAFVKERAIVADEALPPLAPTDSAEARRVVDPSAPRPEPAARPVLTQLVQAAKSAIDGMVEVKLSPEELGRVRLAMTTTEGGMTVLVTAERAETLDLIRRNIDLFEADLAEQGFTNLNFSFGDETAEKDGSLPDQDGAAISNSVSAELAKTLEGRVDATRISADGRVDLRL